MAFQLTINPLKVSEIPSEEIIIAAGREILTSSESTDWKQGKWFDKYKVQTSSRSRIGAGGPPWHCRVSVHAKEDATFEEMWDGLANEKAIKEAEYIPTIAKVTEVKKISPTQTIWTLYYTFPLPISPRVFTVLQVTHLTSSPRTGIIVSIPIDLASNPELLKLEEKGVKGQYVAVERIVEQEDGKVEWRMATSSNPGGNIPAFVTDRSLPGQIASDVGHFVNWSRKVREKKEADGAEAKKVTKTAEQPTVTALAT